MTDLRLNTAWAENLKVRKLCRKFSAEGPVALINLWCYTAENHPEGALLMSPEDVELAARWEGESGAFVKILLDLRLLDEIDGGFAIHNWAENQPYIVTAPARKQRATQAARARWLQNEASVEENAHSMPEACGEHADRYAPTSLPPIPPTKPSKQLVDSESAISEPGHVEKSKTWLKKAWLAATGQSLNKIQREELLAVLQSVPRETLEAAIIETGRAGAKAPLKYCLVIVERMRSEEATAGKESGNTGPAYHSALSEPMGPESGRFAAPPPDDFLEVVGGREPEIIQEKDLDPWD